MSGAEMADDKGADDEKGVERRSGTIQSVSIAARFLTILADAPEVDIRHAQRVPKARAECVGVSLGERNELVLRTSLHGGHASGLRC